MRDKVKRFISILMTALMLVNLMPVGALAEGVKISNSVQGIWEKPSANVYVYVKVTGDKAGLTINPSGWYTIGKSANVPGMGIPSSVGPRSFRRVGVWPDTVLDKSRFTRHADNQKIDLDKITWTEFYIDNGADNYVPAGTYTWHMNGTIDIKQLPSVYTIKYVDYDTKELIHSYEVTGLMGQKPEKITAPDSLKENLYSFYFVNGHPKEQTVDFTKDKGELTFYYKKNTAAYTVNYYLNGTKTKVAEPKKGTAALGKSVTESPITVEGYTPVSNDSQTITIKANSDKNVINFYYYKNVTLTANSDEKTYNGNEQTVKPGYTCSEKNVTFDNIAEPSGKGTDAGTYPVNFEQDKTKPGYPLNKVDTTEKYIVTAANPGTLTINKRSVTLTSGSGEKVYDGTALTNGTVTVGGADGFADGEGATYDVTGSQTVVGESDNTFTYTLNKGTKADNYTIEKTEGKLKVTAATEEVVVTITGHNSTVTYNGSEQSVNGYDVSIAPEGVSYTTADFSFNGTAEAKGTDAGTYQMGLKADQFTNNNDNFKKVTFVVNDGTLTINPVDEVVVTITGHNDTVPYDGDEHTVTGYDVSIDNELYKESDFTFSGTAEAKGTNAGTYPMGLTADQFTNNKSKNFSKVTFEVADGWLKINPIDKVTVTITGRTLETTYDGKEHDVFGYDATPSNALYRPNEDIQFNGTDYNKIAKGTDAGTYPMGLEVSYFTNISDNFTNVEFIVTDGYVKINPRPVMLTSANLIKVYDGTPLTNGDAPVKEEFGTEKAFPEGEGVTYAFTGGQTNAGSSKNMFTYAWNEGTNKDNYTIYQIEGDLVVTPIDGIKVTITGHKDTQTYDGKPHKVEGYDVKPDNPLFTEKDIEFNGEAEATGTDVRIDPYQMGLKPEQFTNTSNNFTNVEFVVEDGQIVITPRAVTLTSETAGKTYDGTALEKPVVTVGGDGFVEGQVKEIKATGSVTNAGSVANTITFTPNKETFKDGNYAITKTEGTLTIAKRSVLITSQSATKTYDGSALTRPAVTITGDGFVPGELAKAEATGSITNVGSTPNAIQYTTTGAFNAANYSIALSVGTLTVTEKPKPEPRRTFNLTINYVYQNGKRAAASYNRGGLKNGETFDITSPVIAGYTASETVVSGTIYNRDIKVTVIYTADGVNLDDYGVPLGLGNITMNVGDCFE
mgnify:CR=1 FL=1